MIGTLHDGEALNAHERLQPVELLPHSLGEASQAHDRLEEGHAVALVVLVSTGRDNQQERVVGHETSVRAAALALERVRILAALVKGG